MKTLALALILATMIIAPIAAGNPMAEQAKASLYADVSIGPHSLDASIKLEIPVQNITGLDGTGQFSFSNGSFNASLNLSAFLVNLEMTTGRLGLVTKGNSTYDPNAETVSQDSVSKVSGELNSFVNGTSFSVSFNVSQFAESYYSFPMQSGVQNKTYSADLSAYMKGSQGEMQLTLSLNGSETGTIAGNTTSSQGSASGSLSVSSAGVSTSVDLSVNYSYDYNMTSQTISIEAQIDIIADDYLTAQQIYLMLSMLVAQFNLSDYVSISPPSFTNPVVSVTISYTGQLNMTFQGIPLQGQPFQSPELLQELGSAAILLPSTALTEAVNASYCAKLNATIDNGSVILTAKAKGNADTVPSMVPVVDGTVDMFLDQDNNYAVIVVNVSVDNLPEPFTGFALLKKIVENMSENENISYTLSLRGQDGVMFRYMGDSMEEVTLSTGDNVSSLAIVYNGLVYYYPDESYAEGWSAPLPIVTGKITLNTSKLLGTLPYPARLLGNLTLEVPDKASVEILSGAEISGTLIVGAEEPTPELIPEDLNATPIGYAVTVRNVSGMLDLRIKLSQPAQNVALLVLHDNGSVSLITNVTVNGSCLIARVPASSIFVPVQLQSGTTTPPAESTTTSGTTETQPAETTSPSGRTTTTTAETPTQGITTTTVTTTMTFGEPTEPSTTTTGQAPPGQSLGETTAPPEGQEGVSLKAVGAIIAVLIVVGVALVLLKR